MFSPDARQPVHEALEESVRRAVGSYYRLGQLMAAPDLLDWQAPARRAPDRPPRPVGQPRASRGGC
jgi:hypothetical protein